MTIFYFINYRNHEKFLMSFATNSRKAYLEELHDLKNHGYKITAKWRTKVG